VVAKATKVALLCSVDELASTQGHKVEMFNALVVILHHSFPEGSFGNRLADIFEDEIVWPQINVRPQSIPFLVCVNDRDTCPETTEESLILA
jgi:hypothetical protein